MSTSGLRFRHLDVTPDQPVESWPFEAVLTAVERGTLPDWRRLARAIDADPWGQVAEYVLQAVELAQPYGTEALLRRAVEGARRRAAEGERAAVAEEVRSLVRQSGMAAGDFARRIGTSASRFSTYASGRVTPSAALMVRMRRVAGVPTDR